MQFKHCAGHSFANRTLKFCIFVQLRQRQNYFNFSKHHLKFEFTTGNLVFDMIFQNTGVVCLVHQARHVFLCTACGVIQGNTADWAVALNGDCDTRQEHRQMQLKCYAPGVFLTKFDVVKCREIRLSNNK